jgi:hypothetical protein
MKRIFAFAIALLFALPALRAQESMFNLGDKVINLGIGLGNTLYISGAGYSTSVPPISISYEQAIVDEVLEKGVIGVGGYLGYTSYKYRADYLGVDWGWNWSNIILGAGGNFHYPLVDNLDTYAGLLLGYNISTVSEYGEVGTNVASSSGGFVFSGYIGGRYYFSEKFAAFAQLGYGVAYLTLGVSIRL